MSDVFPISPPSALEVPVQRWPPQKLDLDGTTLHDVEVTSSVIWLCPTAPTTVTGFAPSPALGENPDGQMLWMINEGAHTVTIAQDDAGSVAANRYFGNAGADLVIPPFGGGAFLIYNATAPGVLPVGWR
jgi:hypothetical protein